MIGAGIGIGKILSKFRDGALNNFELALAGSMDDKELARAMKNPRKHLETVWQAWSTSAYPRALKELSGWREWRGLSKLEREGRADAYLCGYWRGLHDSLFLVFAKDDQCLSVLGESWVSVFGESLRYAMRDANKVEAGGVAALKRRKKKAGQQ